MVTSFFWVRLGAKHSFKTWSVLGSRFFPYWWLSYNKLFSLNKWPSLSASPVRGRAWPPLINCYGPWHWDLALGRVPPTLSASQDARNSCRNSNSVAENEPRTLSLALSLALSRALYFSLPLTHTHTHPHTHRRHCTYATI